MSLFRRLPLVISLSILAFASGVLVWPKLSWAVPDCIDVKTSGSVGTCSAGRVCIFGGSCALFDLSVKNQSVNSNSLQMQVTSNALVSQSIPLSSCLGTSTSCMSPTVRPSLWTSYGTAPSFSIGPTGLRPARTYTFNLFSTFEGRDVNKPIQATTWPGFPAAPTVSNIQPTSATIAWTTPFSGTTDVYFGPTAPSWLSETTGLAASESVYGMVANSSGEAWAVTNQAHIVKRSPGGTWTFQSNPDGLNRPLRDIDTVDSQNIWAVGDSGLILHSINGGTTWTVDSSAGVGSTALLSVVMPTSTNVWTVGQNETILNFNGTVWTQVHQAVSGEQLNSVWTVDGKQVWAVGKNGALLKTNDAGATWTTSTLPSGVDAYDITSLDGQTLWAGGAGGHLWRSLDAGTSWTSISNGSIDTIDDIDLISPTELWFTSRNQVGHIINADAGVPVTTLSNRPGQLLQGATWPVVHTHGDEMLVGGQGGIVNYFLCNSICNYQSSTAGTNHSLSFTNPDGSGELGSNILYYFSVQTTGSGVTYGASGSFRTLATDTTPPTISFTDPNPSPKYTTDRIYYVTGTAQDTDNVGGPGSLALVNFTDNGTSNAVTTTPNLPGPSITDWSVPANLIPGLNTLVATARDTSGNQQSATAQLILDTTLPTVTITAPTNGSTVNTASITATGSATDNEQVSVVEYQLNGGARQPIGGFTAGPSIAWSTLVSGLTLGSNTLTVFARDLAGNERSASVTFTYAEPTFTLDVSPNAQTKNAGDTVVYSVAMNAVNGFNANVSLTASGTPAGSTVTLTPNPIQVNGAVTSTLTIITNPATTCTCSITVTGSGGGKSASETVTLTLNPAPDFSLSAIPVRQDIIAGDTTSYQIRASANSTFNGTVSFSLAGAPVGVNTAFSPGSVPVSAGNFQTTSLNVVTQRTVASNNYTLTVTGTSGALSHTVTVILGISSPPDFTLAIQPISQTTPAGGQAAYNGTATAMYGFNEQVTMTVTSAPADPGLGFTITPAQFVPATTGTQFVLNVTTTSAVRTGTYTLTVTGTSASLTKTFPVSLVVNADTTPPVISNIVATPNWDRVRIQWQTDEPADSEVILYSDAAHTSVSDTFTNRTALCTNTCHDVIFQPLNPTTTYYFTVTSRDADVNPPLPTPNSTTVAVQADGSTPLQFTTLDEPDAIPPSVVVNQPADGTTIVGTVTIIGSAGDNKKVANVQITVSSQIATPPYIFDPLPYDCNGPDPKVCDFSINWNTVGSTNGTYYLSAVAVDSAGNKSPIDSRTITLDNDNTPPQVTSGPTATVSLTGENTCGANGLRPCYQAIIRWTTAKAATSEVDYCAGVTCGYNHTQVGDALPTGTSHEVTLINLDPDQLYHYRISSCNISGLCTH